MHNNNNSTNVTFHLYRQKSYAKLLHVQIVNTDYLHKYSQHKGIIKQNFRMHALSWQTRPGIIELQRYSSQFSGNFSRAQYSQKWASEYCVPVGVQYISRATNKLGSASGVGAWAPFFRHHPPRLDSSKSWPLH